MAIIVEEEKKGGGGFIGFLTWIILIAVIAFATYYIFFKKPERVEVIIPANFENISEISAKKLDPEVIQNNPVFRSLESLGTPPSTARVGRANPFLPL